MVSNYTGGRVHVVFVNGQNVKVAEVRDAVVAALVNEETGPSEADVLAAFKKEEKKYIIRISHFL